MLLTRIKKGLFILLLSLALPASVLAESNELWDKLSIISADGWSAFESVTEQELSQLISLSESGNINAQYALGVIYMLKHEHDKAEIWLKSAAEQGHIPAGYSYNLNVVSHTMMAGIGW